MNHLLATMATMASMHPGDIGINLAACGMALAALVGWMAGKCINMWRTGKWTN